MPKEKVTIKIPKPLYNTIKEVITDSGFDSPTDFIVYVLRDIVSSSARASPDGSLTPAEVRSVRDRLKNLGYF